MEQEKLKAIVETMNGIRSIDSDNPYYLEGEKPFGKYVTKDTSDEDRTISFGKRTAKAVLEEHGAIPIKTLHINDKNVIHIWFEELDTKEVTREIYTIE